VEVPAAPDVPAWASEAPAMAAAEPEPAPVSPAWVSKAPAMAAAAEPELAPVAEEETRPVYAAAVESLVTPQAGIVKASAPALSAVSTFRRPVAKPVAKPRVAAATGRFVVQLGAFNSASGVERAWAAAYKRYGFSAHTPLSTTVRMPAGTFHRLSVAGFQSRAEASQACRTVKAKGGVCFVRGVAGDAPVRWASRYSGRNA
jgi:cell division septation protein DedD